ncbi:MAG: hypothetical protein VZS44_11745 [Bacilli bacterium]|nr:hypothetical protein [Bacilli bacterium]
MVLDYRTCTDDDIKKALTELAHKKSGYVRINNIYPGYFEDIFDMEIDDENGFDMDWWGHMYVDQINVSVFGCCRYGYAIFKFE